METKCSLNVITSEAAYKVMMSWYMVPTSRAHVFPSTSGKGCCDAPGDVLHTWRTCPFVIRFWSRVFNLGSPFAP